jgi:hypothetical protein
MSNVDDASTTCCTTTVGKGFEIVSLQRWWEDDTSTNCPRRMPLLDVRSAKDFEMCRIEGEGLTVVPLEMKVLKERSFELPARHLEFSLVCDDEEMAKNVHAFLGPKPGKSSKQPWKVRYVILANDETWKQAKEFNIYATATTEAIRPLSRLWQPDSMIEHVLLPLLLQRLLQDETINNHCHEVWDLASGAGRDVAFLAEALLAAVAANPKKHSTTARVVAIDHRYNAKETNIVTQFFRRRGVLEATRCIQMDLSSWEIVQDQLDKSHTDYSTIVAAFFCVRFWKRGLVHDLANASSLQEGTLFAISHFCKPSLGAEWAFDHPSEKTVLERYELRDLFSESKVNWEILHDEIAMDSDHGRTMIHFLAKRVP